MTLKNLMTVAAVAALTASSAVAQPSVTIDLVRIVGGPNDGLPELGPNGGLQYSIAVSPDTTQPVFGAGAGINGTGASLALELGLTVDGAGLAAGFSSAAVIDETTLPTSGPVTVNVDSTPGSGNSLTDDGNVEFANPGFGIFGFEVPNFDTNGDLATAEQIGGIQVSGNNIFAALGTTFFATPLNGPYEVLVIETARLDSDNGVNVEGPDDEVVMAPDGVLTIFEGISLNGGSTIAQSTDLSDPANPLSQVFSIAAQSVTDAILAGDANLDGTVDGLDFSTLSSNFNGDGNFNAGEFNDDGVVDGLDFSVLSSNFNSTRAAPVVGGSAVPEPASIAMLILGAGLFTVRRK